MNFLSSRICHIDRYILDLKWNNFHHDAAHMRQYKALLTGLGLIKALKAFPLFIHDEFELVIEQCQGIFETKDPTLMKYLQKVQTYLFYIYKRGKGNNN